MNNNIQLVLKSSTAEMSLNDHDAGIYLVPDIDGLVGLPEIRTTSGVNAGYDGGWTSAQNFDARSITLRGVIANTDVATVERMRKQLISLLAEGKNEQLTLDLVTEAGNAYELQVRTIACDMALQRVLTKQEFMIQLRADDPLIYDNSAGSESVIVQVQRALGGFTIDFELPLAISGGQGDSTITNAGLEKVYPVVKMYGALHNPVFVNQTTNQQIQINTDLSFAEGMWHTPSELYEGVSINIPEAPDNAPLASFRLDGETSQNGTPTPDVPVPVKVVTGENVVKICGKNLFDSSATPDYVAQQAWVYFGNGTYTAITNGYYFESGYRAIAFEFDSLTVGQQYTLSFDAKGNSSHNAQVGVNMYSGASGGTKKNYTIETTSARISFTFTATSANRIAFNSGSTSGADLTITNIQLELGSTATAYEPYQCQSYEVNLGKNLLAPTITGSRTNRGATVSYAGDKITLNQPSGGYLGYRADTTTLPMTIKQGQSFAFTMKYKSGTINTGETYSYRFGVYGVKADNSTERFIDLYLPYGTATPSGSIVGTATSDYIGIALGCYISSATNTTTGDVVFDVQLERGTEATDYAAYFTPIELCKIRTYQDYIYKSGGKWYKHAEVGKLEVDTSTVTLVSNYSNVEFGKFSKPSNSIGYGNYEHYAGMSTHGEVKGNPTGGWNQATNAGAVYDTPVNTAYWVGFAKGTGLNAIKVALEGCLVYYPLATPTDTEITNQALVAQLDALLNNARTYAGVNNIFTVTPNEQGTLEITYYTERDADKRDELIIDSRMRTATLNGTDVYHLIAAGSEFPMLAPGENKLMLRSDIPGDNGYAEVNYKQGYLSI